MLTEEKMIPCIEKIATSLTLPGTAQVISLLQMMLQQAIESMTARVAKQGSENG